MKVSDQPNNMLEFIFTLVGGVLIGAGIAGLYLDDLHKKKLDIIDEDVVALYSSFNECYKINSEILETFEKDNRK